MEIKKLELIMEMRYKEKEDQQLLNGYNYGFSQNEDKRFVYSKRNKSIAY